MTKYNDIEIQTAKNLLKEGYKWLTKNSVGTLYACKKITPVDDYTIVSNDFVPIFESIRCGDEPVSLESIVHPQILDDAEKRYLKGVIRPFRDKVLYIAKRSIMDRRKEHIYIDLTHDVITLPCFMKGTMYKGMKADKEYTPEELGL